jgi:CubicO group peptidase (beta-lactamase class C family)
VRKTVFAWFLALCLLAGCAAVHTGEHPEQSASAPALGSTSPAVTASAQPVPASDALAVDQPASASSPSPVQTPEKPVSEPLSAELDKVFSDNSAFAGSVLIEKEGRIVLCKAYGMADAEKGIKNTPVTTFLVGSVTKQFTAMAVMQLYVKGLLDINDTLAEYIPDFSRGGDITLWNLLTQTSGITDYMNDEPLLLAQIPYEELSAESIIALAGTKPLKFEPGAQYSYCNTNYVILGYIVERISGMSYGDYLEKHIFEPLGMKHTGVFDISKPPGHMAAGHMRADEPVRYFTDEGEVVTDTASFVTGSYGAGCLYSTVVDLYLWDKALKAEKLIPKEYIDRMFYPSVPVPGAIPECAYGFGWVIDSDPHVGTIVRHTGILSGFRAYNGLLTDKDMTVIVLSNIKEFDGRNMIIPAVKQVLKSA